MAIKKNLKTRDGTQVWPISVTDAIYDREQNKLLSEVLKDQQDEIDALKSIDHDQYIVKEEGKSLVAEDEINKIHEHANQTLLDSLTQEMLDNAGAIILVDSKDTNEYDDIVEE